MKFCTPRFTLVWISVGALATACVHTPPGTSVEIALAKRPEVVRLPAPPPTAVSLAGRGGVRNPAVEPELPASDITERVADSYTRGQFCMKTGNDAAAIVAFQEAVKLDPGFSDAWHNLAALYEKAGEDAKALEAFRKSKAVAQQ